MAAMCELIFAVATMALMWSCRSVLLGVN